MPGADDGQKLNAGLVALWVFFSGDSDQYCYCKKPLSFAIFQGESGLLPRGGGGTLIFLHT